MKEKWLPVVGYEDRYEVSDLGRVRTRPGAYRARGGWIHRPSKDSSGYLQVRLSSGEPYDSRCYLLHRIVAASFIGPCPKGHEVDHMDGDRTNNGARNLEYVTPAENARRANAMGRYSRPREKNGRAKLAPESVAAIRMTTVRASLLAQLYDVSRSTIWRIRSGRGWA